MEKLLITSACFLVSATTFQPTFVVRLPLSVWILSFYSILLLLSKVGRLRLGTTNILLLFICIMGCIVGATNLYDQVFYDTFRSPLDFFFKKTVKAFVYLMIIVSVSLSVDRLRNYRLFCEFTLRSLIACELLATAQLAVYSLTGYDIKSAVYSNPIFSVLGPIGLSDLIFDNKLRVTSWCHEPKGLAVFIFTLIMAKLISKENGLSANEGVNKYLRNTLPLSLLIIVQTGSNAILVAPFIIAISLAIYHFVVDERRNWLILKRFTKFDKISFWALSACAVYFLASYVIGENHFSDLILGSVGRRTEAFKLQGLTGIDLFLNSIDPEDAASLLLFGSLSPFSYVFGLGFGGFANNVLSSSSIYQAIAYSFESPFVRNGILEVFFIGGFVAVYLLASNYFTILGKARTFLNLFKNRMQRGEVPQSPFDFYFLAYHCSLIPVLFIWRYDELFFILLFAASNGFVSSALFKKIPNKGILGGISE